MPIRAGGGKLRGLLSPNPFLYFLHYFTLYLSHYNGSPHTPFTLNVATPARLKCCPTYLYTSERRDNRCTPYCVTLSFSLTSLPQVSPDLPFICDVTLCVCVRPARSRDEAGPITCVDAGKGTPALAVVEFCVFTARTAPHPQAPTPGALLLFFLFLSPNKPRHLVRLLWPLVHISALFVRVCVRVESFRDDQLGSSARRHLSRRGLHAARAVKQQTLSACLYPGLTWEHGWSVGLLARTSPARALPLDPHTTPSKSSKS